MLHDYSDITSKITEKPTWYDERGVPRYCDFIPNNCSNIYASVVIQKCIKCQHCFKSFKVQLSLSSMDLLRRFKVSDTSNYIKGTSFYGDPPAHNCTGDSMSSIEDVPEEVFIRGQDFEWKRV